MKTKDLKEKLIQELSTLNSLEEVIDYFIKRNAFNEKFKNENNQEEYEVVYKNRKIQVDITKNKIFSCYDSEDDLKNKMKNLIKDEEYEKAQILKNYMDLLEII
jgi:mRNA-degrading endonuclease YafQ of YafQ-DinJ toxin-antitoxin module